MADPGYTADEIMSIVAARQLRDGQVCFVGIGLPSEAANLARLTHAPGVILIYESGTIGTRPVVLPLSIGDGELAEQADLVVSVPEIFAYWLQAGRVEVGFLSAAQIDRFGNLNSTVIGDYGTPQVRLPGAGGAPEIASNCGEIFITMAMGTRAFVDKLPFITSFGHGAGKGDRERLGLTTRGPTRVITDLCVMEPDPDSAELTVVSLHPGVAREQVEAACGWPLRFVAALAETPAPTAEELAVLRDLHARTRKAHGVAA